MMRRRHTVPSWEEFMALVARVQALESSREGAAPKPDESSASGEGAAASPAQGIWFASGETD